VAGASAQGRRPQATAPFGRVAGAAEAEGHGNTKLVPPVRLNALNITAHAHADGETLRPIKLRLGGFRFSMERDEAIALATELIDAVDALGVKTE
jgi:hypothetical protein